jgi:replicative DNA helicase
MNHNPRALPTEQTERAIENERALFGACILKPTVLDEVGELVGPHCFADADLGRAFGLLLDLHAAGKPIADLTLLVSELRKASLFELIGGAAFVGKAANEALPHNANWYARQVRELWQLRELHATLIRGAADCAQSNADPAQIVEQVESRLAVAREHDGNETHSLDSMVELAINEANNARRKGQTLGLPTGIPKLDEATGGLFPGELTILAARPSIGKSAFACEVGERLAKKGKRVLIVSLEMSATQIAHRFLNRVTAIPVRRIQSGELTLEEMAKLDVARQGFRSLQIMAYVAPSATVARIRARARVLEAQGGIDLVIVDYLGLLEVIPARPTQYERITAISRQLKALAIDLNRPVLALCQLNRESAKAGGLPTLENLRDSGAIEQDADNVWLIHREDRDETETKLIVAKQRQGPIGTLDLEFDPKRMSFGEPGPKITHWKG